MTEPKISNARPVYRVGDRVEVIETGEPMIVYGTDDDDLWIKCQSESARFVKPTITTRLAGELPDPPAETAAW